MLIGPPHRAYSIQIPSAMSSLRCKELLQKSCSVCTKWCRLFHVRSFTIRVATYFHAHRTTWVSHRPKAVLLGGCPLDATPTIHIHVLWHGSLQTGCGEPSHLNQ